VLASQRNGQEGHPKEGAGRRLAGGALGNNQHFADGDLVMKLKGNLVPRPLGKKMREGGDRTRRFMRNAWRKRHFVGAIIENQGSTPGGTERPKKEKETAGVPVNLGRKTVRYFARGSRKLRRIALKRGCSPLF